jgi:hypothetical protein
MVMERARDRMDRGTVATTPDPHRDPPGIQAAASATGSTASPCRRTRRSSPPPTWARGWSCSASDPERTRPQP